MKRFAIVICILFLCIPTSFAVESVQVDEEIVEAIIEAIIQTNAQSKDSVKSGSYTFYIDDSRDGLIIGSLLESGGSWVGMGVVDVTNRKLLFPFKYLTIQFFPNGNLFAGWYDEPRIDNELKSLSYYSTVINRSGTEVTLKSLPDNCCICGVDERGYATICIITEEGYYRLGLLDVVSDALVLTPIADCSTPGQIEFRDEMAVIQIGSTVWGQLDKALPITGNGKYGVIDRTGNFIIPPEYGSLNYLGERKFDAWLTIDGKSRVVLEVDDFIEKPSSWAQTDVSTAINTRLVPLSLQSKYTQSTTRAEFCALAVALYENIRGEITERKSFTDTKDVNVEKMAAVGVVNGTNTEGTLFSPDAQLTREQAATMLARLADAIGKPLLKQASAATDKDSFSPWAAEAIGQVQAAGVMNSTSTAANVFSPKLPYTREQSIITILRLYTTIK